MPESKRIDFSSLIPDESETQSFLSPEEIKRTIDQIESEGWESRIFSKFSRFATEGIEEGSEPNAEIVKLKNKGYEVRFEAQDPYRFILRVRRLKIPQIDFKNNIEKTIPKFLNPEADEKNKI